MMVGMTIDGGGKEDIHSGKETIKFVVGTWKLCKGS
jgi:hypothetical protein